MARRKSRHVLRAWVTASQGAAIIDIPVKRSNKRRSCYIWQCPQEATSWQTGQLGTTSYQQFNGQGRLIFTTSRALKQWTCAGSVNGRSNGVRSFPVGKVLLGIFLQVHWQQTVCTHRLTTYLCILPHLSWKRLLVLRMIIHIISNLRKIAVTHSITVHSSWNQSQRLK